MRFLLILSMRYLLILMMCCALGCAPDEVNEIAVSRTVPNALSIKDALENSKRLEVSYYGTRPPLKIVVNDSDAIKSFADVTDFRDAPTVLPGQFGTIDVFAIRALGEKELLAEFCLVGPNIVTFSEADTTYMVHLRESTKDAAHGPIKTSDLYELIFPYFEKQLEEYWFEHGSGTREIVEYKLRWAPNYPYHLSREREETTLRQVNDIAVRGIVAGGDRNLVAVADAETDVLVICPISTHNGMISGGRAYHGDGKDPVRMRSKPKEVWSQPLNGVRKPHSLMFSPDGRQLYVCSRHGSLLVYPIDPFGRFYNGEFDEPFGRIHLDKLDPKAQTDISGIVGPARMSISPDGRFVYVVGRGSRSLSAFERNGETGKLTHLESFHDEEQDSDNADVEELEGTRTTDGLDEPTDVAVSPDGKHVYVVARNDGIVCFRRDQKTGRLDPVEILEDSIAEEQTRPAIRGLQAANILRISSDGQFIYTGTEKSGIGVWKRNPESGKLAHVQTIAGIKGTNNVMDLVFHPDGKRAYVAAYDDNAVAVFNRTEGKLELYDIAEQAGEDCIGLKIDGLTGPMSLGIHPEGGHLYVGSTQRPLSVFATKHTRTICKRKRRKVEDDGFVPTRD